MKQMRLTVPARKLPHDSSLAIVNIVLLLIFFFLSTGSLTGGQKFPIALPETLELPLDLLPKPLLILDQNGEMTVDGVPVARGELNARVATFPTLHILADRDQNAGALLDIIAAENLVAVELKLVTLHRKTLETNADSGATE